MAILCAFFTTGTAGALAIGASMVPRAEITLVVMERGRGLGSWAVPDELYAAFVITSALTWIDGSGA